MSIELKFRVDTDENDAAELSVGFRSKCFAGQASAWMKVSQIKAFADALLTYPLSTNSLPVLSGGYWDPTGSKIIQEHVYVSAQPKGGLGAVCISVRLAAPYENATEPKLKYSASVDIASDYAQLSEIRRDLLALVNGESREAIFVFERSAAAC